MFNSIKEIQDYYDNLLAERTDARLHDAISNNEAVEVVQNDLQVILRNTDDEQQIAQYKFYNK